MKSRSPREIFSGASVAPPASVVCNALSSLRHKLRELVREVHGVLGQDAFDDQSLRVEEVAVVLEVLRILARFVQCLQAREDLMMRIDLKDAARLEHRIVHLRERMLHR